MINEFRLTDKEAERAREFVDEHRHKDVDKGAIGGHITYSFTPNGLFRSLMIKCSICGKVHDITDYDVW
jgi:hypothetical protein